MQKKFLNSHRNPMTVLHMVNFKWAHYLLQLPSSPPQHNSYLRNHGGKHDMVVSTTTRSQINSPLDPRVFATSKYCYRWRNYNSIHRGKQFSWQSQTLAFVLPILQTSVSYMLILKMKMCFLESWFFKKKYSSKLLNIWFLSNLKYSLKFRKWW